MHILRFVALCLYKICKTRDTYLQRGNSFCGILVPATTTGSSFLERATACSAWDSRTPGLVMEHSSRLLRFLNRLDNNYDDFEHLH